jgi:hypothetical protein
MAGVAAKIDELSTEDMQRMHDAGLRWLRSGIRGLDQERFFRGEKQPESFLEAHRKIAQLRKDGFEIMGLTPSPMETSAAAGKLGSPEYFGNYRSLCTFLGQTFKGLIDYWQIANEVDIEIFRGKLTLEQAAEFLKAGLRGMKDADRNLKVGINITLFPSKPGEVDWNTDQHEGVFIAKSIYEDTSLEIDYAGFDSYPGTCRDGGAESWDEYLDAFYELTKKPIIIQEFGYSAAGEVMTEEERKSGIYPCKIKKWKFAWKGAHTPEVQAEFVTESCKVFARKPYVIGATYYSWKDTATCWECGSPDCPIQTAFGLVDLNNNLKPSYHCLKSSLKAHFNGRITKILNTPSL